jgi:CRISPR-associated endonuclease/helicase Cas3
MSGINYREVFEQAFGSPVRAPYSYQCRLACGGDASPDLPETLERGTTCRSMLIEVPTGLGKTAAVVLAWLWNRVLQPDEKARAAWPRRLVYCLPMRTLVEQTAGEVKKWIDAILADEKGELTLDAETKAKLQWLADKSPIILMGGEDSGDWDIHPEKEAILIGTQDMLLSRALNRGYGSSRARWPMHFGLLNNDCLWVLDETQLMGVGVRTSAQLEGFREKIGTVIGCATWWASATLDSRLLGTPDHSALPIALGLAEWDLNDPGVGRRLNAIKRLSSLPLTLTGDSAKITDPHLEQLAAEVVARHQPETTTIVILNRVDRAKDLFTALEKIGKMEPLPRRILVHSRFRPLERNDLSRQIKQSGEKIIVATQAIEAGVDISSRTLITELAPWSSLVQRFGRCNRNGEFNDLGGAEIFWINLEAEEAKAADGLALPYNREQLATARTLLREAEPVGAAPSVLARLHAVEPLPKAHILRRKDLVDLFDTTPDLAGLDIDVGRYIRDGEERDVQAYWREIAEGEPPAEDIVPLREELVRVPVHAFKKFAGKNKAGIWFWNVLDGKWQSLRADHIAPGRIYLVDSKLGGYSVMLGWTGEKSKESFPVLSLQDQPERRTPRDGQDRDDESQCSRDEWQSLETHTAHVTAACEEMLRTLPNAAPWAEALRTAARWHDVGKAHDCFQAFITANRIVPEDLRGAFVAKSPWKAGSRHSRPHFRHELASALAWLQIGNDDVPAFVSLVAYLIATHHGKIRLSLRAMPGEAVPKRIADSPDSETPLYARGVWQDDKLPSANGRRIGIEGFPADGVTLDLTCMQMGEHNGRPSWASRTIALRNSPQLGLFRLAWLETILRAADAAGSRK